MALEILQARFSEVMARMSDNFVAGLADFIVVLVFLGVGYVVARFLASLVKRGLYETRLERKLAQKGLDDALAGFTLTDILVTLVKVATFAIFLGVAADVTNLGFLNTVILWFLGYLPRLVEGVVIMVVALLGADYVTDRVRKAKELPFPGTLSTLVKLFVGYTALVIAMPLVLPGADVEILRTFFTLLVGAFALAIGLGGAIALGYGLKDTVDTVAKERKNEMRKLIG